MTTQTSPCVIGVDVGGTNTDVCHCKTSFVLEQVLILLQAVLLQGHDVLAWHKAPTTANIQTGVQQSIQEVIQKGTVSPATISSVHIGTTASLDVSLAHLISCVRANAVFPAIRQCRS